MLMQVVCLLIMLSIPLVMIAVFPCHPAIQSVAIRGLKFGVSLVQFVLDETAAIFAEVSGVLLDKVEKISEESQNI